MATIVTRAGKGSPLTHVEVDANFTNLNTDKLESGSTAASLTVTSADINGGTIDGTVIGGTTPAAISGTTGQFGTSLNVDGTITSDGLTVDGNALVRVDSSTDQLTVRNNSAGSTATPAFSDLRFNGFIGEPRARIRARDTRSNAVGGDFVIQTAPDNINLNDRLFISRNGDISFYEDTGTTPKFFWDASAESLGIGTSNPADLLHVSKNGDAITRITSADGLGDAAVRFYSGSTYKGQVGWDQSSDVLGLYSSGNSATPVLAINSSGNVGIGTTSPSEKLSVTGNVTISGSLSKGSGSFKIDHPIKPDTHHLVHSFIEGPQADNIYRGKVTLVSGVATVNLDKAGRMTEGTFVALNGNVQCFTTNEDAWTAVRGRVEGNTLTIEAQDAACTDTVSWLVIGERHDQHMIDANWTDDQGRIITEPAKETVE